MSPALFRPRPQARNARTPGGLHLPDLALDRRSFLSLSAAGAGALALAACAGPSTASAGSSSTPTASAADWAGVKPAKEISFWSNHPGGSQETEQKLVDAYNASQSGTKVTLVTAGKNYEEVAQRFQTALAGGGLPGLVIFSDVWWFRYYLNQSIIPLTSLLKAVKVDTADFRPSFYSDYQYAGEQWAVPYARSTPLFYYNKPAWEQAGLPDRGPTSWQEFGDWGPQLQRVVGDRRAAHGWANALSISWTFEGPNWAFGGAYSDKWKLTFTEPDTIAAGNFFRDSVHTKGYAVISNDTANEFATGILASTVGSTGALVGITNAARFDFGVAPLPTGPGGAPACPTGGAGLAIPAKLSDERKLNALRFIAFLTSPASTAYFNQRTGYLAVRKSVAGDPSQQQYLAANPRARVAGSKHLKRVPTNGVEVPASRATRNAPTTRATSASSVASSKGPSEVR